MTDKEISILEDYFIRYSTREYRDAFTPKPEKIKGKYYHDGEDYYKIIIFDDNSVYQINSDHELCGSELKNLQEFDIRFRSFVGCDWIADKEEMEKIYREFSIRTFDGLLKENINLSWSVPHPKHKDEWGNTDWRDTGEMGG
jgi:hypothetical protein